MIEKLSGKQNPNVKTNRKTRTDVSLKYTGIPAPIILPDDPWFGPSPIKSEKQMTHEEMLEEASRREESNRKEENKEPDNIHEVMYNFSTHKGKLTIQINPPGGSETFQEGSGDWMSGMRG
tara:strand:- start:81 stop:443 length:363 start_codon:yes stop_codon:yes gene_type:complete